MNTESVNTETVNTEVVNQATASQITTPSPPTEPRGATATSELARDTLADGPRPVRVEPVVDVVDMQDSVLLVVDLPGVPADALTLQVQAGVLTLEGLQNPVAPGAPLERKQYVRRFRLADTLDPDRIEARMDAGVLSLTIAKTSAAQPRSIPVRVG